MRMGSNVLNEKIMGTWLGALRIYSQQRERSPERALVKSLRTLGKDPHPGGRLSEPRRGRGEIGPKEGDFKIQRK